MARILVVDDEAAIRKALERFLTGLKYQVLTAKDGDEALAVVEKEAVDLALVDLVMPRLDGVEFIRRLKKAQPACVAIVLTGFGTITSAVEAMKAGAYHYLTKPFELDDIAALISTALEHRQLKEENRLLKRQLHERYRFENIVGHGDAMAQVYDLIEKVAETDSTVLITGESGTGKELVARAIHYNSPRRDKPLVVVNCAAIPEELLESELFGHVKGAFTGAVAMHAGRFDAADGGTIFLDEIGDMSLKLQVKVLRVLQEQRFEPVGSTSTHEVDVRIIAATNQDLECAVRERRFREDLFYRLNVIPIHIPPLRERREDIPLLVEHFIHKYAKEGAGKVQGISGEALDALMSWPWKGNVRELENLIERMVVLKKDDTIQPSDLSDKMGGARAASPAPGGEPLQVDIPDEGISFKKAVSDYESRLIVGALRKTGGNKNKAASLLKLNRTTLVEKIKKKHLEADEVD
ncbi:MAG: sigma-54-dependent Fis family transcriptional regulator [Proteobacteria bacterium]|nr:sigma-54-dependent Fis family transcriptional regulator [Pseudomonadota bacterium]